MKRVTVMIRAKVSVTEEPVAGKLRVRVCEEGARQRAFLLRDEQLELVHV